MNKADAPDNWLEIRTVAADAGRYLDCYRVVARRRSSARLNEIIVSVPSSYMKKPLLRTLP